MGQSKKTKDFISKIIEDRNKFFNELFYSNKENLINSAISIANAIEKTYKDEGKVIIFGNGGSNAQSSHLATELIIRFKSESKRNPIAAICISADPSVITAAGNDYNFDDIFARQLKPLLNKNDCVLAFSTSGKSPNIVNGIYAASEKISGENIFLITGNDFIEKKNLNIQIINTPVKGSTETYQEFHLILIHLVCNLLEKIN